jgi:hypothetical protein
MVEAGAPAGSPAWDAEAHRIRATNDMEHRQRGMNIGELLEV